MWGVIKERLSGIIPAGLIGSDYTSKVCVEYPVVKNGKMDY